MEFLLALILLIVFLWFRGRLAELESRITTLERWDRAPAAPPKPVVPAMAPPPVPPPVVSSEGSGGGAGVAEAAGEKRGGAGEAEAGGPMLGGAGEAAAGGAMRGGAEELEAGGPMLGGAGEAAAGGAVRGAAGHLGFGAGRDWESVVGGNWLNKLGVVVLVIGIALALGYSFTRVGPGGRVAISLAASFTMLGTGVALESRYRVFARGLLGGGWAALYFTTYAMHAVEAARVVEDPYIAAFQLLAVTAGMIGHSLRYRSETVTGLAYFMAFVTLVIAEPSAFAVLAMLPLAGSLLYVARRFEWRRMALFGVIGTYGAIALRGDSGAPLWQAQAVFAVFWLLFEAFDILAVDATLLLPNGAGFLGLSILAWQNRAPADIWQFAAVAAGAYLVSAILRRRSDWWPAAAVVSAALAAAAIFVRGEGQWTTFALLLEAEALYLAGVRLRAPFLRHLGSAVFALALAQLANAGGNWVPAAAIGAAMFYVNSFVDRYHGYAGAVLLTLIVGREFPNNLGLALTLLAAASFAIGWWWRRFDLRTHGYAIGVLAIALLLDTRSALGFAAAIFYAGALCGRFSSRIAGREAEILRFAASLATGVLAATAVWQAVPERWAGICWMALAALLLELGVRDLPSDLRQLGLLLAGIGGVAAAIHVLMFSYQGAWTIRSMPLGAAGIAAFVAFRAPEIRAYASFVASGFAAAAAWTLLPSAAVAPVWAALALCRAPRRECYPLAAAAFLRSCDPHAAVVGVAAVVLILHGFRQLWASLAGSLLLAILLYNRVSGSLLTVAWGAEGVALLLAGFPLRDRILRLSGLYLLLFCILKAFVYDLRYLETLPRIFSFIVLGLILVAVSWLYARFRAASRPPTAPATSEK